MDASARWQEDDLAVVVWCDVGAWFGRQHGEDAVLNNAGDPEPWLAGHGEEPLRLLPLHLGFGELVKAVAGIRQRVELSKERPSERKLKMGFLVGLFHAQVVRVSCGQ